MAIDLRAASSCNIGELIEASISDSYIQESGLIFTTGSCQILAELPPRMGTIVTFEYTKDGISYQIPRKLRVLSSFKNQFTGVVDVSLGCKLTYLQDLSEKFFWTTKDDFLNQGPEFNQDELIFAPIYASSVAQQCLDKLGITASGLNLTNKFSIPIFDFSSGYVSILSDLLVSEGYCGYLDYNENLVAFKTDQSSLTAPVFDDSSLIELQSVNSGELAGEKVVVNYSTLRLKTPEQDPNDVSAFASWEEEEVIGAETEVELSGTYRDTGILNQDGEEWTEIFKYKPRQVTRTYYDDWSRMVARVTESFSILPAGAGSIVAEKINKGSPASLYNKGFSRVTIDIPEYKINPTAIGTTPPEDYDKVVSEQTIELEPEIITFATLGLNSSQSIQAYSETLRYPSWSVVVFAGIKVSVTYFSFEVVSITTRTFEQGERTAIVRTNPTSSSGSSDVFLGKVPLTKTLTFYEKALAYTTSGQRRLSKKLEEAAVNNTSIDSILAESRHLVEDGFESRIITGREAIMQSKPDSDIYQDPLYAERSENQSDLEFFFSDLGSSELKNLVEFDLPYAPDDVFVLVSPTRAVSIASDAPTKALNYGRVQNRIRFGSRFGLNVQVSPETVPSRPFSDIAIQIDGTAAAFKTNACSWTIDSSGVVAGFDAIFWAGIGGTGTIWFPVPPGVTTLPALPEIIDGTISIENLINPWNESAAISCRIRTQASIERLSYALNLETTIDPLAIFTTLSIESTTSTQAKVPSADIQVAAVLPTIATGASVESAVALIEMIALAPAVTAGASVSVSAVEIAVIPAPGPTVPRLSTVALSPAANVGINAIAPTFVTGVAITPPSVIIALDVLTPRAGGNLGDNYGLTALIEDDLLQLL